MEALLLLLIAILTLLFLVARAAARAGRNIARDMRAEAAVLNYLVLPLRRGPRRDSGGDGAGRGGGRRRVV
nr:MAG: hypothetical protein TU35_07830 [Thermoproteus sp. AZ2]